MRNSRNIDFHPARNPLVRMNAVCPYFTMYPLPFPYERLRDCRRTHRILDPFCGRGTTNFAARLRGLESFGIDSNPVAAAVAQAKLIDTSAAAVGELCRDILLTEDFSTVPRGDFWRRCYHSETLTEILKLRAHFLRTQILSETEIALRAVILGILHGPLTKGDPTYLSNQMPRTYATKPGSAVAYWKARKMKPPYVPVTAAVQRRANYLFKKLPPKTAGGVRLADSRLEAAYQDLGEFDAVITSPPYLGMRTYWPDQWVRNWFMGGPDYVEYAKADQIQSQEAEVFAADLTKVWKRCATACRAGASMVIRFGALPSYEADPSELIKASLDVVSSGWRIVTIKRAGLASKGRRQADQFKTSKSVPVEEIDVHCRLAA